MAKVAFPLPPPPKDHFGRGGASASPLSSRGPPLVVSEHTATLPSPIAVKSTVLVPRMAPGAPAAQRYCRWPPSSGKMCSSAVVTATAKGWGKQRCRVASSPSQLSQPQFSPPQPPPTSVIEPDRFQLTEANLPQPETTPTTPGAYHACAGCITPIPTAP
jgi:hypothetical protein